MTQRQNWSTNHSFAAARILRPASLAQAQAIVARAARIHAVGARHSFNDTADSPGEMIDMGDVPFDITIDAGRRRVSASGAVSYGMLAQYLHAHGWALHNMASLPHITLAGATQTGTHGSGDGLGTLSAAVAELELIGPEGDVVRLARGDADFAAAVVGLGAFGVICRITLDIEPDYRMRQDAYEGLAWEALIGGFDAVMGAGTSVSLFTRWNQPTVERVWSTNRLAPGAEDAGEPDAGKRGLGLRRTPLPFAHASDEQMRKLNPFGTPGPAAQRLCHFRMEFEQGLQLQSEVFVPRGQAAAAIAALRPMAERIDRALVVTEVRSMAGDALWLSPAFGGPAVGIHFSWRLEAAAEVAALTRDIEAVLWPLGARPHWGKILHAPAAQLAAHYPRMADFRAAAVARDPGGKFRNAFLDRHVFGVA